MPVSSDVVENPWLKMALNNAWSNATLYRAATSLDVSVFTAKRPGFFPSLAATLNHIYDVDLYYLDALENAGQGRRVFDRAPCADPKELAELQMAADMRFASFTSAITSETLNDTRVTDRSSGPARETVAALILHLAQHQIHHRGQAHVQLSDAGIAPPQLDEFYLEFDRAPTASAYW